MDNRCVPSRHLPAVHSDPRPAPVLHRPRPNHTRWLTCTDPLLHSFHGCYDYATLHDRPRLNFTRNARPGETGPGTFPAPCARLARMAGSTATDGGAPVKFRVERDVLADAVAWAARSLRSGRASRSWPASSSRRADEGLRALHLRLRDLGPGHAPGRGADEGQALVPGRLLADICRSLPAKPVEMAIDGAKVSLTCGSRGSACRRCRSRTTRPSRHAGGHRHGAATSSRTRSPRRSPPRAATTCSRC